MKRISVAILGIVFFVLAILIVRAVMFPPRPMFHNYRAEFGEKGPLRFWATPPPTRNNSGSQEIHIDIPLNIIVFIRHSDDPTAVVLSGSWTGHGTYTVNQSAFVVDHQTTIITPQDKDSFFLISPTGSVSKYPLSKPLASFLTERLSKRHGTTVDLTPILRSFFLDHEPVILKAIVASDSVEDE